MKYPSIREDAVLGAKEVEFGFVRRGRHRWGALSVLFGTSVASLLSARACLGMFGRIESASGAKRERLYGPRCIVSSTRCVYTWYTLSWKCCLETVLDTAKDG